MCKNNKQQQQQQQQRQVGKTVTGVNGGSDWRNVSGSGLTPNHHGLWPVRAC